MAIDKVVDSAQLDAAMAATARAIRTAGGTSAKIAWDKDTGFANAISNLSNVKLTSLEVLTPPNKTSYYPMETFSITGLVLKATYSNGATREVTDAWNYTISPSNGGASPTFSIDSEYVTVSYTEAGVTLSVRVDITILNPISEGAAVATGLSVNADAPLRAITYHDGRYLAVETASATEQVFKSNFTKAAPATVTRSAYNAARPYPVKAIITDGNLVWMGNTTERSVAPYSDRYLLRAPYSTFITTTADTLNVFATSGAKINACAGWLNGYCWMVGRNSAGNSFVARCDSSGAVSTQTYSSIGELTDVCIAGGFLVAISRPSKKIIILRNPTGSWSANPYTLDYGESSTIEPVAIAYTDGSGETPRNLFIAGIVDGEYKLIHYIIPASSGFQRGALKTILPTTEVSAVTGLEYIGDYVVATIRKADGSSMMEVLHIDTSLASVLHAKSFAMSVTSPVLSCAADGGMSIIGQASGKYTLTQLTEASA